MACLIIIQIPYVLNLLKSIICMQKISLLRLYVPSLLSFPMVLKQTKIMLDTVSKVFKLYMHVLTYLIQKNCFC